MDDKRPTDDFLEANVIFKNYSTDRGKDIIPTFNINGAITVHLTSFEYCSSYPLLNLLIQPLSFWFDHFCADMTIYFR